MRQVAVEGIIWSYEELPAPATAKAKAGKEATTIVILHGWGRSGYEWLSLANHLRARTGRRVIVPDLPGFGGTTLPMVQDIFEYTELLIKFLKYLGINSVSVVGHSLGGRMGVVMGAKYPEMIEKIVLIAPAAIKRLTLRRVVLSPVKILRYVVPTKWREWLRDVVSDEDGRDKKRSSMYRAVVKLDLRAELPKIRAQTLVVFGERDRVIPLSLSRVYNKALRRGRVRVIWEAEHDPHLSHPRELARTVEEVWI